MWGICIWVSAVLFSHPNPINVNDCHASKYLHTFQGKYSWLSNALSCRVRTFGAENTIKKCTTPLSIQITPVTSWFCKQIGNRCYGSKKQRHVFLFFERMKQVNHILCVFLPGLYAFIINFTEILFEKYISHTWEWSRFIIRALQREKSSPEKEKQKSEMTCWELLCKSLTEKGLVNSTFQRSLSVYFSKLDYSSLIILKQYGPGLWRLIGEYDFLFSSFSFLSLCMSL